MMREYFGAVLRSFYSGKLYAEVAKNWTGLAVTYLALLLVVGLIPVAILFTREVQYYFSFRDQLIEQMPDMELKQGTLSTAAQQPYTVKDPTSGEPFLLIDTRTAKSSRKSPYEAAMQSSSQNALIILRGHTMELHTAETENSHVTYSKLLERIEMDPRGNYSINQASLKRWAALLEHNMPSFAVGFYLINGAILTATFLFRALLFSVICMGVAQSLLLKLDFPACYRMALVASTPLVICELLTLCTGQPIFVHEQLIYFLMHAAYCYFAVESVKKYSR